MFRGTRPQKYFDRFPLDSIQLPKYLDQDVVDLPEAAQKLTKSQWHEWIVANKQWKKAVQGYLASLSFADDMIGELLTALDDGAARRQHDRHSLGRPRLPFG